MTLPTIAIIGAGNMGQCLLQGLAKQYSADKLWASNPNQEKLLSLKNNLSIHITTDNKKAAMLADVVILAVKPMVIPSVVTELKEILLSRKPLIISTAAGIRVQTILDLLGEDLPIVRAMPNTPVLIGCGATALFTNPEVSSSQKTLTDTIFKSVGIVVPIDKESDLDCVTALSASGVAYFFLVMEALIKAAEKLELDPHIAKTLVIQTVYGAACMAKESHLSLSELRQQVTSPGGTTEKGISVLEENNIQELFSKALAAAKKRSEELAQNQKDKK